MKRKSPIQKAAALFDSKAAFARALEVSPCYVGKMLRENHVPWQQCKKIQAITNNLVTAADLRPDIFAN
jgi:DNA-binding transcriptional regulator YdaS (Cro superfamily)